VGLLLLQCGNFQPHLREQIRLVQDPVDHRVPKRMLTAYAYE